MKTRLAQIKSRRAATRVCALALALSIAACGSTHQPASSDAAGVPDPQAEQREAEAERRREVRGRAIGKVAEATARGVLGTVGGALYGGLQGLASCASAGPLALLCVPIGAVVGGVMYGVGAAASTPGLGDSLDAALSEPETSTSSEAAAQPVGAAPESASGANPPVAVPGEPAAEAEFPPLPSGDAPTATEFPATQPSDAPTAVVGTGALHQGDRWEYAYVDSRDGRPASRRFEIVQFDGDQIVERIEMEDGRTLTATHRSGAYLEIRGGMQFAPYYFAFQRGNVATSIGGLAVRGGDACEQGPKTIYRTAECEVSAEFVRTETVAVPAGTFEAQVVRIKLSQEMWSSPLAYMSGPFGEATFWISPEAGRIVKAEVRYDLERPWTETMELVSGRALDRQATTL